MRLNYAKNPLLSEEERELQNSVRKLSERHNLLEKGREYDDKKFIDAEVINELKKMGLFGIIIPEQYGGCGGKMTTYCAAIEELSRTLFSASNLIAVHAGLGTYPFLIAGNEKQKEAYLPSMASGEKVAAFGITEPEAGADITDTQTKFAAVGDKYILNGSKRFITNGSLAEIVVTLAREKEEDKKKSKSMFIVESGYKGFSSGHIEDKMALNAVPVSELFYDNMEVPADNLLGERGQGLFIVQTTLDHCRTVLSAGVLGLCKQGFDIVLDYTTSRTQKGKPLSVNTSVQDRIGMMKNLIEAMESSVYFSAAAIDNSVKDGSFLCSRGTSTKVFCTETAYEVFRIGSELLGGNSFVKENFERLYREATVVPRIYEGPNSVCNQLTARDAIKNFLGK